MGYDELVPDRASSVAPLPARSELVPIQIGLVRLGGISCNEELPDSGYKETIAMGIL